MKSSAHEWYISGLRRQADLDRKANVRPPFTRSRRIEANVDMMQLRKLSSEAAATATGYIFTFDSSTFDGPDVLA